MANFYSSTLQKGSKGDEVKKWQEFLNTQGYGLGVDGDFGVKTDAATRDYQTKNGLTVDGIVGANTWGKAGYSNVNTPTATPTATSSYTYTPFEYKDFTESDETKGAKDSLSNANDALTNLGDFNWVDQGKLDDYTSQYENRDKFSYDFNTDALYQQYKDKYIKQAKMASADVMGQASAMTGGYGSSYAQTVGNQAYQSNLEQLNDVIPELYQLAYDKYNQEGQDMLNMISLLRGERDFAYGQYNDEYNKLANDRDYWSNMYSNLYNRDYSMYADDRNFAQTNHNTAESYKYQADRDAVADAQWQATFEEGQRQYEQNLAFQKQQYEDSKLFAAGGGYNVTTDANGKPVVTPTGKVNDTIVQATIPADITKKASEFTSNDALANWAYGLEDTGVLQPGQADQLIATYMDQNERYEEVTADDGTKSNQISYKSMVDSTAGWTVVSKGGGNFVGIDANAKVTSPNGQTMTLKALRETLKDEGMTHNEATRAIKKLQQNLGISSNWLFGW